MSTNQSSTHEPSSPDGSLTWKKLLFITGVVIVVTCSIGLILLQKWKQNQPQPIAPDVIIDNFGNYESLSGATRLTIGLDEDPSKRKIAAAVESVDRKYPIGVSFEASADWFAALDESDRVWLYTSSDGVRVWTAQDGIISGVSQVADENWRGVPKEFLEKLPKKHRAEYQTWAKNQGLLPAGTVTNEGQTEDK